MKKAYSILSILSLLGIVVFFHSCAMDKCHEKVRYNVYEPVQYTKEQLREVKIEAPKDLERPGKIYVYKNYLFINEMYEGVHIFDNSNPASPKNLVYISIHGNIDIAVRDDILYADNFIDLLTFDISDINDIKYLSSTQDVFNRDKTYYKNKGYTVYMKLTDKIIEKDCSYDENLEFFDVNDNVFYGGSTYNGGGIRRVSSGPPPSVVGTGGSMSRFYIGNNRLYAVDGTDLKIFKIDLEQSFSLSNEKYIAFGIETLFGLGQYLFIGANNGMYIFDASNPDNPAFLSQFLHVTACDPVFVKDDVAYITLRSNSRCRGFSNQMDVVDISDIMNPKPIRTYSLENPHGLAVTGDDKIIVCEGDYGIKVLDGSDVKNVELKYSVTTPHSYDVIALDDKDILIVGNDGLYQYKLEDFELKQISSIPVVKE